MVFSMFCAAFWLFVDSLGQEQSQLLHELYVQPLPTMNSRSAVAALAVAGMACCVLDQWSLPLFTRAKRCDAAQYTTRFWLRVVSAPGDSRPTP